MNHEADSPHYEFLEFLQKNKLQSYRQALENEGFEMLASLLSLNADETNELSTAISMKLGHKRMFGIAVEEARKEKDEQEQKRKREKSKQQKEEELAEQLCEIKRKQKLAKARRRDVDSISTAELTAPAGLGASAKSKIGHKGTELPATKAYAAFLSHKKMHTTHGEMSETLALRIKVKNHFFLVCAI
jgi:phage-related minor tail protein